MCHQCVAVTVTVCVAVAGHHVPVSAHAVVHVEHATVAVCAVVHVGNCDFGACGHKSSKAPGVTIPGVFFRVVQKHFRTTLINNFEVGQKLFFNLGKEGILV